MRIKVKSAEKNQFGTITVIDVMGNKYQAKDADFLEAAGTGQYVGVVISDKILKNKATGESFVIKEIRYENGEEAHTEKPLIKEDQKPGGRPMDQKLSALQTAFKGACGIFEGQGIVAVPKVFAVASAIYSAMTREEIDWYDYGKRILMVTIPDVKIVGTAQGIFNKLVPDATANKLLEESQFDIDGEVEGLDDLASNPLPLVEDGGVEDKEREQASKKAVEKVKGAFAGEVVDEMPKNIPSWMMFYVECQKWYGLVKPSIYQKIWGKSHQEWVEWQKATQLTPQGAWEQVQKKMEEIMNQES